MWLGIFGVGSIVVLSLFLLYTRLPLKLLPKEQAWSFTDVSSLLGIVACLIIFMIPLDILGGLLLPNRFKSDSLSTLAFVKKWISGVTIQATLFFFSSLLILIFGRLTGFGRGFRGFRHRSRAHRVSASSCNGHDSGQLGWTKIALGTRHHNLLSISGAMSPSPPPQAHLSPSPPF